jgi:hypothetical protein
MRDRGARRVASIDSFAGPGGFGFLKNLTTEKRWLPTGDRL